MSALRTPILCIEKQRLLKEYTSAVSDWARMHSAHVAALKGGEKDVFDEQLSAASDRVDNAKYAVIAHQEMHGC